MSRRTRARAASALALPLLVLAAPLAAADPVTYEVDAAASTFEVATKSAGVLGGLAHDHVIRAARFTGRIVYDKDAPERSSVVIEVDARSLEVVDKGISADDRREIAKTMHEEVLRTHAHRTLKFVSKKVRAGSGGLEVTGELTLAGETKEVEVAVAVDADAGALSARGSFSFLQTRFGIEPYSAGLGTIKVADAVRLSFAVKAKAR